MKPVFIEGATCPSCQSEDTVGLNTHGANCIGWCSCGIVWIIKTDINQPDAADVELVYSFTSPLEDAIAAKNKAIDESVD